MFSKCREHLTHCTSPLSLANLNSNLECYTLVYATVVFIGYETEKAVDVFGEDTIVLVTRRLPEIAKVKPLKPVKSLQPSVLQ